MQTRSITLQAELPALLILSAVIPLKAVNSHIFLIKGMEELNPYFFSHKVTAFSAKAEKEAHFIHTVSANGRSVALRPFSSG